MITMCCPGAWYRPPSQDPHVDQQPASVVVWPASDQAWAAHGAGQLHHAQGPTCQRPARGEYFTMENDVFKTMTAKYMSKVTMSLQIDSYTKHILWCEFSSYPVGSVGENVCPTNLEILLSSKHLKPNQLWCSWEQLYSLSFPIVWTIYSLLKPSISLFILYFRVWLDLANVLKI